MEVGRLQRQDTELRRRYRVVAVKIAEIRGGGGEVAWSAGILIRRLVNVGSH